MELESVKETIPYKIDIEVIEPRKKRKYEKRKELSERKERVIKNPKFNYNLYFKVGADKIFGKSYTKQKDIADDICMTKVAVNRLIKYGNKMIFIEKNEYKELQDCV